MLSRFDVIIDANASTENDLTSLSFEVFAIPQRYPRASFRTSLDAPLKALTLATSRSTTRPKLSFLWTPPLAGDPALARARALRSSPKSLPGWSRPLEDAETSPLPCKLLMALPAIFINRDPNVLSPPFIPEASRWFDDEEEAGAGAKSLASTPLSLMSALTKEPRELSPRLQVNSVSRDKAEERAMATS